MLMAEVYFAFTPLQLLLADETPGHHWRPLIAPMPSHQPLFVAGASWVSVCTSYPPRYSYARQIVCPFIELGPRRGTCQHTHRPRSFPTETTMLRPSYCQHFSLSALLATPPTYWTPQPSLVAATPGHPCSSARHPCLRSVSYSYWYHSQQQTAPALRSARTGISGRSVENNRLIRVDLAARRMILPAVGN